jgi:glycosyltransferase involved in cell wall biosynthesis
VFSRRYALIIPALNEAEAIGELLRQIPRQMFAQVIVADNGSTDGTAAAAREARAEVVCEPRRGYGNACLAAMVTLDPSVNAVAFMDADLSDDPLDLPRLAERFEADSLDLIIGSRVLGNPEPGALTPLQRFGNALTSLLIRWIWGVAFTDLGPMRIISRQALDRLRMSDPNYGWTVEMQAKAARLRMKVAELPVAYRRRRLGKSKVSGTVTGSVRAGIKILWTVYRSWRTDLDEPDARASSADCHPHASGGPTPGFPPSRE